MEGTDILQILLIKIPFIIGAGAWMYILGSKPVHQLEIRLMRMELELMKLKDINLTLIEKIIPSANRINAYKNINNAFNNDK